MKNVSPLDAMKALCEEARDEFLQDKSDECLRHDRLLRAIQLMMKQQEEILQAIVDMSLN